VSESEFTGTHKVFLTRDYLDGPTLHSVLLRRALLATCLCLVPIL